MTSVVPLKAVMIAVVLWSSHAIAQDNASGKKLIMRLEAMLDKMEFTQYQARTEIDEKKNNYQCDCSGLVCYLLRSDFPDAYKQLDGVESPWRVRPYSVTFYETFIRAGKAKVEGWERIHKMMDARPGDVLAWRKKKITKGVSTGHTLVIAGLPELEKDGRVRVRVRVIDSTRKIHADDSRPEGTNGVGAGTMWFEVDDAGMPVRFFVDDSGKRSQEMMIAIGRLR